MERRNTDDLQNALMAAPDLDRFLEENSKDFLNSDFPAQLQKLFERSELSKAALAKSSGMSEVYLYQLFSGQRRPSRNRVICLCFGLRIEVEEAQELLRASGNATLYARDRRDAVILYGLGHGIDLAEMNDRLFRDEEQTLY